MIKLIKAMWKWLTTGFGRVSEKTYNERKKTCEACDLYLTKQEKCLECGCWMPLKHRIPSSNCPIGKW